MGKIEFTDDNGSFVLENAENYSYLYFPIAGDNGLKSSITPNLGGDSKINQNTFLLEPESSENLLKDRTVINLKQDLCGIKFQENLIYTRFLQ